MVSAFLMNDLLSTADRMEFDENAKWLYNCPTTGYYEECDRTERVVYDIVLSNLMLGNYKINFYSEIHPKGMENLVSYIIKDRRLTANLAIKFIKIDSVEIPGIGYYYMLKVDDGLLEDIALNNYLCRLEIESVMSKVKPEWTPFEEIKYYHDYVCDRTEYIKDTENCYSITGVFVDGIGTCQAYSKAFNLLCEMAGYTAVEVSGYTKDQAHMWSRVCVEGDWYTFDVTWDDTLLKYTTAATSDNSMMYFGLPADIMNRTHTIRKTYKAWVPEGTNKYNMWYSYIDNMVMDKKLDNDEAIVVWLASRIALEYKKGKYQIEVMDLGDNDLIKRAGSLMPRVCNILRANGYNVSQTYKLFCFSDVLVIEMEGI